MTDSEFARRVLIAAAILTVAGLVVVAFWYVGNVLLVLFGGVLVATFLRTLAEPVARAIRAPPWVGVGVVAVLVVAGLVGVLAMAGPKLAVQARELFARLPDAIETVEAWAVGRGLLPSDGAEGGDVLDRAALELREGSGRAVAWVAKTAGNIAWIVASALIMAVTGLYMALQPLVYRAGLVRLVPLDRRARASEVLLAIAARLRRWLFGQLTSMAFVGLSVGVGLALIRVPLGFLLAVLAFLCAFVPNLGIMVALSVAVLVTLVGEPDRLPWVVGLYVSVSILETYFVTPMVQRTASRIPPALLLGMQVLLGATFGLLGVLMATPLTAAALVAVQRLYQEDVLGEPREV